MMHSFFYPPAIQYIIFPLKRTSKIVLVLDTFKTVGEDKEN